MIRRPTRSKRTDTLFPYTTLFRSKFFSYSHRSGGLESQSPACELVRAVERFGRRRRPTVEVTLDPQAAIADHDGIARLADRRGRWAARVEAAARRNRCRTWITPIDYSLRQAESRIRRQHRVEQCL